ncbi:hypothetical protein [Clostridium sp.]|uniref:XkdQ/YqbQ family protein n=1 Tax=Clostridium sp. TaxID=1506 RepID=UPI002908F282|nr:hypothetical protein [Clostridium sp.]MDU3526409.1 hypothetical protein [Clostridium sp.]
MIEFLVEVDGKVYEISDLVTKVTYTDKLNDGCSKLEFSYINKDLVIKNGSTVRFKYNNANIFFGYIFKVGQNSSDEITVTAYDQLRYCKAKDTIIVSNSTLGGLAKKMCNYFGLRIGNVDSSSFILPNSIQDDKTWLDIMYNSISDALMSVGRKYSLRDEFGYVALRDLENLKLNLILGDESLAYDYEYEKSIDDEFYNLIKLVSDNESTGKRDVYIVKDSNSINKYGLMQYFEVLDKNYNNSQAKTMADNLLKLYNRETETLNIKCIGDTSVRAGNSFLAKIKDINLDKRLIVKSATHSFLPHHTMDLEVMI